MSSRYCWAPRPASRRLAVVSAAKAVPDATAAAGAKVLEQQPRPASPAAVAAATVAERELQKLEQLEAAAAEAPEPPEAPYSKWERVYVNDSGTTGGTSSDPDAADRPPVPLAARPQRRTTTIWIRTNASSVR